MTDPDRAGDRRLLVAFLECVEAAERGALPDPDALLADEPALAAELRDVLRTCAHVERLLAPVRHLLRGKSPLPGTQTSRETNPRDAARTPRDAAKGETRAGTDGCG